VLVISHSVVYVSDPVRLFEGAICVIAFILVGIVVEEAVLIGVIVLATIHVLISTSLTAFFVFSINLLDLLEFLFDSKVSKEFRLLIMR
jgi:hypothetical protein